MRCIHERQIHNESRNELILKTFQGTAKCIIPKTFLLLYISVWLNVIQSVGSSKWVSILVDVQLSLHVERTKCVRSGEPAAWDPCSPTRYSQTLTHANRQNILYMHRNVNVTSQTTSYTVPSNGRASWTKTEVTKIPCYQKTNNSLRSNHRTPVEVAWTSSQRVRRM